MAQQLAGCPSAITAQLQTGYSPRSGQRARVTRVVGGALAAPFRGYNGSPRLRGNRVPSGVFCQDNLATLRWPVGHLGSAAQALPWLALAPHQSTRWPNGQRPGPVCGAVALRPPWHLVAVPGTRVAAFPDRGE